MTPVLVTSRLSLRELTTSDCGFLRELMNEPAYIANIGDRGVRSDQQAEQYIEEKYVASYARHGYGLYLVELKPDAQAVGICGLVRRDALEHPDLGFAYLQRYWSRGFAAEAATAVLAHARDGLSLAQIDAVVSPDNVRSIRLLGRLGFRYARTMRLPGMALDSQIYESDLKPA